MERLHPTRLALSDKLDALRQLDTYRKWYSLDDQRRCLQCGKTITGRQIELYRARGSGPFRAHCPTEGCQAIPIDWALPNNRVPSASRESAEHAAATATAPNGNEIALPRVFPKLARLFRPVRRARERALKCVPKTASARAEKS